MGQSATCARRLRRAASRNPRLRAATGGARRFAVGIVLGNKKSGREYPGGV
jgi:hypothetical protein